MKQIFTNRISQFVYVSFAMILLSTILYVKVENDYHWYLIIWNDFLAVVPLFCAMLAEYFNQRKKKAQTIIFSLLWLLFFPNSPYMLTDIKYSGYFSQDIYTAFDGIGANYCAWVLVTNLAITVIAGIAFGMFSLYLMHRMLRKYCGRIACTALIAAVLLLSSFGIYIGRFARVNSWDIVRPAFLFDNVMQTMTTFTPVYVLLLTFTIAFIYIGFYMFIRIFHFERK